MKKFGFPLKLVIVVKNIIPIVLTELHHNHFVEMWLFLSCGV